MARSFGLGIVGRNQFEINELIQNNDGKRLRYFGTFVVLIELRKLVNVSSEFLGRRSNRIQFGFGWGGSGRKLIIHTIKDGQIFMERRHKKRKRR